MKKTSFVSECDREAFGTQEADSCLRAPCTEVRALI